MVTDILNKVLRKDMVREIGKYLDGRLLIISEHRRRIGLLRFIMP